MVDSSATLSDGQKRTTMSEACSILDWARGRLSEMGAVQRTWNWRLVAAVQSHLLYAWTKVLPNCSHWYGLAFYKAIHVVCEYCGLTMPSTPCRSCSKLTRPLCSACRLPLSPRKEYICQRSHHVAGGALPGSVGPSLPVSVCV